MADDTTVKDIITALADFPEDMPVYFGVKLTLGSSDEMLEFDDWLEFYKAVVAEQAYRDGDDYTTRDVVEIKLRY